MDTYTYAISGYYTINGNEQKHFHEEIEAKNNIEAMEIVIGKLAWDESLKGNTFMLDLIHYD